MTGIVGFSMEGGSDAVSCLAVGDYTAANPGGGREGILPAVSGEAAGYCFPGGRAGGGLSEAVGGTWVLFPRAEFSPGGGEDHGGL